MFNRNLINSIQDSLKQVINETKTSERNLEQFRERMAGNKAAREKKAEELRQKRDTTNSQRNEIKAKIDADIAAEIASGTKDTYAARKKVLDKLAQDQDFQLKARNAGLGAVGRKGGGLVGWNYESQQAAEEGRKRSIEGLFDDQGNAKLADTANKEWNQATGKFDTPMVGKSDNPARYAELEKEAQDRTAERAAAAQQETNNRKFGYKRPLGHPSGYINPNSPEGRIEAEIKAAKARGDNSKDIWARDESGNLIPGQGIHGGELPMDREAYIRKEGDEAASGVVGFNVTGLTQQEIRDRLRANTKQKNQELEQEIRSEVKSKADEESLKNPPKSPDYPSPGTAEDSAKRVAKAALDIRTRAARYAKSRDAQRKTTSDASIRGAGMELRKNIGTIADKTGLSDLLYKIRKTF